jgi:hypothetical protein
MKSTRPIVEKLISLRLKDILRFIPRDNNPHTVYQLDNYGWKYPGKVLLKTHSRTITYDSAIPNASSSTEQPPGRWPVIVCACGRYVKALYFRHGRYSCRKCCGATYLSERKSHLQAKLWQSAKLRIRLNGMPIEYPLPHRPKGMHKRTYYHICDRIVSLEAKARKARYRRIDTQAIAYHL